jgi:hypothetical protein
VHEGGEKALLDIPAGPCCLHGYGPFSENSSGDLSWLGMDRVSPTEAFRLTLLGRRQDTV